MNGLLVRQTKAIYLGVLFGHEVDRKSSGCINLKLVDFEK